MSVTTANAVADFYLRFCREHGDVLTNLKLQKLVYYAQAWHIALYNRLLFQDTIQAWVHGPVIPSLYRRFKRYGWDAITLNPGSPMLSRDVERHLIEVFEVYGGYSAWDLERMTHREDPWRRARRGLQPDEEGTRQISVEDMRHFYRGLANQN